MAGGEHGRPSATGSEVEGGYLLALGPGHFVPVHLQAVHGKRFGGREGDVAGDTGAVWAGVMGLADVCDEVSRGRKVVKGLP
jgi:hypothetical protein